GHAYDLRIEYFQNTGSETMRLDWAYGAVARVEVPQSALSMPPDLTTGLGGYWKLDETTGTTAADSSGAGNDGVAHGMNFAGGEPWITGGQRNGAINLVAARKFFVQVPDDAALDPTGGVTVSAWVKAGSWAGTPRVVQKGNNNNQYRLLAQNNQLRFYVSLL